MYNADFWECERCTFHNNVDRLNCAMCDDVRSSETTATVHTDSMKWKCPQCTLDNSNDTTKCVLCDTINPDNVKPVIPANTSIQGLISSMSTQLDKMARRFDYIHETKSNDSNSNVTNSQCDIEQCLPLKTLSSIMKLLKQCADYPFKSSFNNKDILNLFHHLQLFHDNDKDFHIIYTACGGSCDIGTCQSFRRNYRNRNRFKQNEAHSALYGLATSNMTDDEKIKFMLNAQIMDKIHCYFQHSYDIGYRLDTHQLQLIETKIADGRDALFVHTKYGKIKELLRNKHETFRNIRSRASNHKTCPYNKFVSNYNSTSPVSNTDDEIDDHKDEHVAYIYVDTMYSFGYEFEYDPNKHDQKKYAEHDHYIGSVTAKYKTFKDELLSYTLCALNIHQFNHEVQKADVHYGSDYYKTVLKMYDGSVLGQDMEKHHFSKNHILSVMIYCNYDLCQHIFSGSYRAKHNMETKKSIRERHSEFYFLGKHLKETVHLFGMLVDRYGTITRTGKIKRFYHGINQQLLFPIMSHEQNVFIPLSTTSSFPVACQFSDSSNGGLVAEFSGYNRYFSCCWLSDYPNEREHLFIQNSGMLKIDDILLLSPHIKNGSGVVHFREIFTATKMLNDLQYSWDNLEGDRDRDAMDANGVEYSSFVIPAQYQQLIVRLIENELGIKRYDLLHSYAEKTFHQFCINRTQLDNVQWDEMKGCNAFLFPFYCLSAFEWVDLNQLGKLYPNLEEIEVWEIKLCANTFDDILQYIAKNADSSKLKKIQIKSPNKVSGSTWIQSAFSAVLTLASTSDQTVSETTMMSIDCAVTKYQMRFHALGWNMYKHQRFEWLMIQHK
eukprot:576369_1